MDKNQGAGVKAREGGGFGWGGGEEWGENADNCNGITIKWFKLKKRYEKFVFPLDKTNYQVNLRWTVHDKWCCQVLLLEDWLLFILKVGMGGFVSAWLYKKRDFLPSLQSLSRLRVMPLHSGLILLRKYKFFPPLLPLGRGFLCCAKILFLVVFPQQWSWAIIER